MVYDKCIYLLLLRAIGLVAGNAPLTNYSTELQPNTTNSTVVESELCSLSAQESEYFHNTFHGRNTEYQNDADFHHISRLSARLQAYNQRSSLESSKSPRFLLFIVGLNQGSLLRTFLRCPTDSISHSFDIQAELIKTAKKKFSTKKMGTMANLLHFELLGMSNETTIGHVGGDTVTAGLYSEDEVVSKIGLPRAKTKNVPVNVTTLDIYTSIHDIMRVDYLVIDAEGHEPLIIQGMNLEKVSNRKKFSAFQIELGVLVGDPRKPHGSLDDVSLGNYLVKLGYELFLIGYHAIMKITPEIFRLNKIRLAHVTSNMLVVHTAYAHPVIRSLVTTGLYRYDGSDINTTITNTTSTSTNTNTNTIGSSSNSIHTVPSNSTLHPSLGLCVVRYDKNEHDQKCLPSTQNMSLSSSVSSSSVSSSAAAAETSSTSSSASSSSSPSLSAASSAAISSLSVASAVASPVTFSFLSWAAKKHETTFQMATKQQQQQQQQQKQQPQHFHGAHQQPQSQQHQKQQKSSPSPSSPQQQQQQQQQQKVGQVKHPTVSSSPPPPSLRTQSLLLKPK